MDRTSTPTLAQLRRIAGPKVEVIHDPGLREYVATAAEGFAFEDGNLHELIVSYYAGGVSAEARADLADRLREYARLNASDASVGAVEPCVAAFCDWCGRYPGKEVR